MTSRLSKETNHQINKSVETALHNKTFPGVEILVGNRDQIIYHDAFGYVEKSSTSLKLKRNSIFDLASLTKPLATAAATLCLVESRHLSFTDPISQYIPELVGSTKSGITIDQLLTHTSGLPAWTALFDPEFNKSKGWQKLMTINLEAEPGSKVIYSCLGYLILAEIIRRRTKKPLSRVCNQLLYNPLNLTDLRFCPGSSSSRVVPTSYCPYRQKTLRGIVHDENAFIFDEEGGNSGLFGSPIDIYRFCLTLINGGELEGTRIMSTQMAELFFTPQTPKSLTPRTYGWDYHAGIGDYMSCGKFMPIGSVGHLGFTGTSLWIDPVSGTIVIVLSNRVNISREDNLPLMRTFRPEIHDLLLREIL